MRFYWDGKKQTPLASPRELTAMQALSTYLVHHHYAL